MDELKTRKSYTFILPGGSSIYGEMVLYSLSKIAELQDIRSHEGITVEIVRFYEDKEIIEKLYETALATTPPTI